MIYLSIHQNICYRYLYHPFPAGGDHRGRLHGGVGAASEERHHTHTGDRQDVPRSAAGGEILQDPPPAGREAQTKDWDTHGTLRRRRGGPQNATLLPLRRHRQHRLKDGEQWTT